MSGQRAAPGNDEFELSIFGPGVGESVVLHLGANEWLIADSCCPSGSRKPAALEYLEGIGVDPASAVKLVVVTHWHDDHIDGISKIFEAAASSKLFCSAALNGREFLKFVAYHRKNAMQAASSGVDEMYRVFETLKRRRNATGAQSRSIGPEWVKANECLWKRPTPSAAVHALSPSSGTLTLALQEFGSSLDTLLPKKRPVAQTANEIAVALWVEVAGIRVLLGSDLEEASDPSRGWQAIVTSTAKPGGKAQILKVPHHGSDTAHNAKVWDQMLDPRPHGVVTTFTSGRKPLPSLADIDRLKGLTTTLNCTSPPKGWSSPRRESAVERTVKNVVTNRRTLRGQMGQVRLRCQIGSVVPTFSIETFGPALRLG